MKKQASNWFSNGLRDAAKEVRSWPSWKQQALQASVPAAEVRSQSGATKTTKVVEAPKK